MNMQTVTFDADLYKIVPIEPTEEMIAELFTEFDFVDSVRERKSYKEMLAVSPPINAEE